MGSGGRNQILSVCLISHRGRVQFTGEFTRLRCRSRIAFSTDSPSDLIKAVPHLRICHPWSKLNSLPWHATIFLNRGLISLFTSHLEERRQPIIVLCIPIVIFFELQIH